VCTTRAAAGLTKATRLATRRADALLTVAVRPVEAGVATGAAVCAVFEVGLTTVGRVAIAVAKPGAAGATVASTDLVLTTRIATRTAVLQIAARVDTALHAVGVTAELSGRARPGGTALALGCARWEAGPLTTKHTNTTPGVATT